MCGGTELDAFVAKVFDSIKRKDTSEFVVRAEYYVK